MLPAKKNEYKFGKKHFKNLVGNHPKVTHEPIMRNIGKQLHIKLGQFTQELVLVLRKNMNRKVAWFDEIHLEVWKTRQFEDIRLRHCNTVYDQNTKGRWAKECTLTFPKKGDLGLSNNCQGIIFTSIAVKMHNALLRKCIEPKIENILRKNKNDFRRNRSTRSNILTIHRILEGVRTKSLKAAILFVDFAKIDRGEMEQILLQRNRPGHDDAT